MLRFLETVVDPRRAALMLTGGYLAAGGALTVLGLKQLRTAGVLTRREVAHMKQEVTGAAEEVRKFPRVRWQNAGELTRPAEWRGLGKVTPADTQGTPERGQRPDRRYRACQGFSGRR
ncbi:hypothetical protein ACFPOI_28790 [Nonomuraea angiospora]|uniref:Uncharacterized protein n=1 Tax=Nonomuraea angiospora TaxID=46172 RepID=A0ABR9LVF1_9ACTN|nr:hypothetical protein [Nonomuraea angiospora]MBE1584066.1 hypothetical protein [Nonomuraea angiospora]